jgi:hypothetical protein
MVSYLIINFKIYKMKTLEQILKQEPVYLNDFSEKKDVVSNFEINLALANTINILFASYGYENYSGDAFVLFEKEGKLYEVNGSHCSCYGLEDQFDFEETSLEAIEMRLVKGTLGNDNYSGNEFAKELKSFLGVE